MKIWVAGKCIYTWLATQFQAKRGNMKELHANPNVIARLKDEVRDLELKIDRLRAFMHKHIDADGHYFDIEDDFYCDYYQAQRRFMEKQCCAMTCYLQMLNERIVILENDGETEHE